MYYFVLKLEFFIVIFNFIRADDDCTFTDLSAVPAKVLCYVERKYWKVDEQYLNVMECRLGGGRLNCKAPFHIPGKNELTISKPPPSSDNKEYEKLALKAENAVPNIWFRDCFSDDRLLLVHNHTELPKVFFNSRVIRNKKLKNLHQCAYRQTFIRKSFSFNEESKEDRRTKLLDAKCDPYQSTIIKEFWDLWNTTQYYGGELDERNQWRTTNTMGKKITNAAFAVLDQILQSFGGIWTGCYKLISSKKCRSVLAAVSQVLALHILAAIAHPDKNVRDPNANVDHELVSGYMFASLGRALLHGDVSSTGNMVLTNYNLKLVDFVAIQSAYLRIYITSAGSLYTKQLNKYIPLAFPPSFQVNAKPEWKAYANSLEPVYTTLRNWMFTESKNLIDFGPYLPLVAFPEVRKQILKTRKRRILIDVGANGFFASPKYLLDSYSIYLPFTHAIMIEPEPHFSATVPTPYSSRYNITFLKVYAEVNTNSETDVLTILKKQVTRDDFVVLKFDVDPNRYARGYTMEWGFLYTLMQDREAIKLVDELYIELHFHFPDLYWDHYHSNWEALDSIRYLRSNGMIVHSWP